MRERIEAGYVPCAYQTFSGERTTAWYRGPLTAAPAQGLPTPESGHWRTADDALIHLTDQGTFDIGYATAWTAGLVHALAHADLSAPTLAARAHARRLAVRLHALTAPDGLHRAPGHPGAATAARETDTAWLREALVPGRLRRAAEDLLAGGLRGSLDTLRVTAPAGPRAPAAGEDGAPGLSPVEHLTALLRDPGVEGVFRDALAAMVTDQVPPAGPHPPGARAPAAEARIPTARARTAVRWVPPHLVRTADRLALVPFDHLVPHPDSMLPPESLRFFHLDDDWLRVLEDGILSPGLHTALDGVLDSAVRAAVSAGDRRGTGRVSKPVTGMLIRSVLTTRWPEVVIEVLDPDGDPLWFHRRDGLAPETTLVLFEGVPGTVTLREPAHGMHLGLDADQRISLRRLTADDSGGPGSTLGLMFPATGDVTAYFRRPGPAGRSPGVVVWQDDSGKAPAGLVPDMTRLLNDAGQPDPAAPLTPAGLALQLLNTPSLQPFTS